LVSTAHKNGLKVIIDVVANHTADVIYLEFGTPMISASEAKSKKPDWLNDMSNYHNQGNNPGITGDFYGLDGIATEKPVVVQGWIDVWSDWINRFNIDGMRIDTFKYVDAAFWKKVLPAIKAVALKKGKTDFPIYGEIYDMNPYTTSSFVRSRQVESVLDFPFQKRVTRFAAYGGNTMELAALFNSDDLYTTATTNASGLITFMGNHDMGRIGYFIRDAVLDSDVVGAVERIKLANALLFLLRGSPALYYGDEKGLAGIGGDKQARQDMFATKVVDWQSAPRIGAEPAGTTSLFSTAHPFESQISQLQALVAANPALREGTQQVRTNEGDVFVVTRYARNQEFLLAFNGSDEKAATEFKVSTIGSNWENLGGTCALTVGTTMKIEVPARGYCIYKAKKKFAPSAKLSVTISAKNIDFFVQDAIALTAAVPGDDYNSVTFSYRKKGGQWITLGTAEKRTVEDIETQAGLYRVYLPKEGLKGGTEVQTIAVVKSVSGKTAASKILSVKIPK
jgi:glycosidase